MSQRRPSTFNNQGISWILHRISAVVLIFVLAGHFIQQHMINHAYEIQIGDTVARMSDVSYFAVMWLFLAVGAFHGLNGVYQASIGEGMSGRKKQAIKWSLTFLGIVMIVQGTRVAWAMTGGGFA